MFKCGRKYIDNSLGIFQRKCIAEEDQLLYRDSLSQLHIYLERISCFPEYIGFINLFFLKKCNGPPLLSNIYCFSCLTGTTWICPHAAEVFEAVVIGSVGVEQDLSLGPGKWLPAQVCSGTQCVGSLWSISYGINHSWRKCPQLSYLLV